MEDYSDLINSTIDYSDIELDITDLLPQIQPIQILALICYGLVVVLGVPGNALVVWVTAFRMPRSVTSLWFLNLALADLLCCCSLPLLMVPLAHDDHWHFGPLACTLVKGLFYLVMYCSVLQLVLISVDRWMLVSRPVWCQNKRSVRLAVMACVLVWLLSLVGSIPQFLFTRESQAGVHKRECLTEYSVLSAWLVTSFRFLMGFVLPFLVIVASHWAVYRRMERSVSSSRGRSKRTVRVILGVVLSFFLCWLPLHIMDMLVLVTPRTSPHSPPVYLAHALALCLAYFNSCLNPLLYVCLGRGFKENMCSSLRHLFQFMGEEPMARVSVTQVTKTTSSEKEVTNI